MNFLATFISAAVENGYRIIKVLRLGKNDAQTANEAAPHGIDSNPVKDMVAVFSETLDQGQPVIVGYINENRLAQPGELRTYSTDPEGKEKFYTWLKSDGTYEIGGDQDNMVRYSKLEEGYNQLKDDFNNLVQIFNAHVHPANGSPTGTPAQPSIATIAGAKIDEVKTL